MATLAIKGNSSSSKSLFHNLNKHTCLMAKENKKKVKIKNSSPQCTSSDDNSSNDECDESFDLGKNPNKRLDKLMKQINLRDELLESREELLKKERENTSELKKLLALKRRRMRSLNKNLSKVRRLSLVSRAQLVLFKKLMTSCKRLIRILKYNLMLFGQPLRLLYQMTPTEQKLLLAMVVKDVIILMSMLFLLMANNQMLSKFVLSLVINL
jgi:hypothetical protein